MELGVLADTFSACVLKVKIIQQSTWVKLYILGACKYIYISKNPLIPFEILTLGGFMLRLTAYILMPPPLDRGHQLITA